MANIQKYTLGEATRLEHHIERHSSHHANEEIDSNKSGDNYSLVDHGALSDLQYLHKRLDEVAHINRRDLIVDAAIIVTKPQEVPAKYTKAFFQEVVNFAKERFGSENLFKATIHLDESTPHIHMGVVPVMPATVKQAEQGYRERLCFNDRFRREEYQNFHRDLQKHMKETGIPGADKVLNGATAKQGGPLTVRELKQRTYEREHRYDHLRDR